MTTEPYASAKRGSGWSITDPRIGGPIHRAGGRRLADRHPGPPARARLMVESDRNLFPALQRKAITGDHFKTSTK